MPIASVNHLPNRPDAALYIHVPFCLQKCPYCDFYSVPRSAADIDSYPELLIRHLRLIANQNAPNKLSTIFFGGGTPSLLAPDDINRILRTAEALFGFSEDVEISLEANPGTIDAERLDSLRAAGINRLSIGVQSLCDRELQLLGRPHTASRAIEAIRAARAAGFDNISCDLMFALPGQSVEQLRESLVRLLEHNPEHLAIYGLTIEEGTPFHACRASGQLEEVDEEIYVAGYRMLHATLAAAGYRHYEISNYARPGFECRHNLRYWQRRANLAIGAGAHSFVEQGWGERWAVPDDLAVYRDRLVNGVDPADCMETFDERAAMAETLYLGLRTAAGVDDAAFRRRFQISVQQAYPEAVRKCADHLVLEEGCWRLDTDGWLLFNSLLMHFL